MPTLFSLLQRIKHFKGSFQGHLHFKTKAEYEKYHFQEGNVKILHQKICLRKKKHRF